MLLVVSSARWPSTQTPRVPDYPASPTDDVHPQLAFGRGTKHFLGKQNHLLAVQLKPQMQTDLFGIAAAGSARLVPLGTAVAPVVRR
jgi:hypothetical protein